MTKKEAMEFLKRDKEQRGECYISDALDMAIKALEQEPCEDAISRQSALNAVTMAEVRWQAVDNISKLPPIISQQRWIPVSERLPELNQRVLVTSYGRVCYAMMTSTDGNNGHPVFRLQDSLKERVVCETTVHNEFTTSRITAWMPLPEPYKAESEGEG